ncbi:MAG: methylisocitrate lyase [Thermoplasmata archaeon]
MSILRDNVNLGPDAFSKYLKSEFIVAPGVYDAISAIMAEKAGFKVLYLSGSGVAARMGLPDLGITTLTEVAEEAQKIINVTKAPLIVDVDTGFGEVLNVVRTVRVLESAGVSAIHLEDQSIPKKCGHLSGKRLISEEDMVLKIKASVKARKNPNFKIIARTDARAVEGFEKAVKRAKSYVSAGADIIFPEALESREEFEIFAKELDIPLLANMTEYGKSPLLSAKELKDMGFKIVIFPLTAFRASLTKIKEIYGKLYREGTQRNFMSEIMQRKEFYELIDYDSYETEDSILYKSSKE